MNICQIASQDLIACLQWVHQGIALSRVPFFQQVLAIAAESHLVSASDYAIEQYQTLALSSSDLPAIETLIQRLEVWPTTPADRAEAKQTSQDQSVSFADALDEIIYDTLCPDWILVEAEGRSLPNAVSIHSFMQEWRSIRDDLPPDGGMSLWPSGPNGPDSPDGGESNPEKLAKQQLRQGTAANSSVVFSQQACISMALGLTNIGGHSFMGGAGHTPIAANLQEQITQALGGNLTVEIAWVQSGSGLRLQLEVGGKTITTDIAWETLTQTNGLNNAIAMVNPQVQQNTKVALDNIKAIASNSDRSIVIDAPAATVKTPIPSRTETTTEKSEAILIASATSAPSSTVSEPPLPQPTSQPTPQPTPATPAGGVTTGGLSGDGPSITPSVNYFNDAPPTVITRGKNLPSEPVTQIDISPLFVSLQTAIDTGNNQALVTVVFSATVQTLPPSITVPVTPTIQTLTEHLQGTPDADEFLLQPGSIQLIAYQSHDRFGLIGGLSYSDLAITDTTVESGPDRFSAYQITLRATGENLAIAIPTTENLPLSADAFFTREPLPIGDEISAGPTMAIDPGIELVQGLGSLQEQVPRFTPDGLSSVQLIQAPTGIKVR